MKSRRVIFQKLPEEKEYELMILADQNILEDELLKIINAILKKHGVKEVEKLKYLYNQQLKYKIRTINRACFYICTLMIETGKVLEIKEDIQKNKTISRFLLLNKKKNAKLLEHFDYKSTENTKKFTSETGRIIPASVTEAKKKMQRLAAKSVKLVRFIGLADYLDRK